MTFFFFPISASKQFQQHLHKLRLASKQEGKKHFKITCANLSGLHPPKKNTSWQTFNDIFDHAPVVFMPQTFKLFSHITDQVECLEWMRDN